MDFTNIGSINLYTKNLKLQTTWKLKQQSGNYTGHTKSLDEWISATQTMKDQQERGDDQLRSIQNKVMAGKKLTPGERKYLKAKDPETYAKLEAAEKEQKNYERELKHCKTKEDVQRLKTSRLSSSMAIVKEVANNPNISTEKKLEIMMREKMRCDLLEESTREFVKRGDYERLPTDAEQAKANQEAREERLPEEVKTHEAKTDEKPEGTEEKPAASEPEAAAERPQSQEKPAIRVESEERRKVRRAKALASYNSVDSGDIGAAAAASTPSLDIQA